MMSKNSFLGSLKSNARRRIWLLAANLLYFFLTFPTLAAMVIGAEKRYAEMVDIAAATRNFIKVVSLSGWMAFFTVILALGAAIQGFSYMYKQQKLDMYESMPVPKGRRYAAIYANGILVYAGAYLFNLLAAFFVAEAMGVDASMAIVPAMGAFLGHLLLFVAIYNIGILAVMLTGKFVVTIMACGVLLFYDVMWEMVIHAYADSFFVSYSYYSVDRMTECLISPVVLFFMMLNKCYRFLPPFGVPETLWENVLPVYGRIAVVAAVAGILAYWCYKRKPAESCNRSIAFSKSKAPIKVLLVVPLALLGGIFSYGMTLHYGFYFFGLIVGLLLSHGVVEIIYEFDIRSVKKGLKTLSVSAVLASLWFICFVLDVFAYDSYVPEVGKLEKAALIFQDTSVAFYDEDLNRQGYMVYPLENMNVEDKEALCEIAGKRMGQESAENPRGCVAKYTLAGGREVYRTFVLDYREDAELIGRITDGESYKTTTSLAFNEALMRHIQAMEIRYDNGVFVGRMEHIDKQALLDAYREDLLEFDYEDSLKELVCGQLILDLSHLEGESVYLNEVLPVYPSFRRTLSLLQEEGVLRDRYVDASEVERIQVINENHSVYKDLTGDIDYESYRREATFTDETEMEEIAKGLYPIEFCNRFWRPDDMISDDLRVSVYFKDGSVDQMGKQRSVYYGDYGYYMLSDSVPDYVLERTKY